MRVGGRGIVGYVFGMRELALFLYGFVWRYGFIWEGKFYRFFSRERGLGFGVLYCFFRFF